MFLGNYSNAEPWFGEGSQSLFQGELSGRNKSLESLKESLESSLILSNSRTLGELSNSQKACGPASEEEEAEVEEEDTFLLMETTCRIKGVSLGWFVRVNATKNYKKKKKTHTQSNSD